MSLPWKKSGRISRFMSEFQISPKRGGSLVVETGFPTSLIDLFVKNRDRLKKSSSKRLQRKNQSAPNVSLPINHDVILEKPVARNTVRSKNAKVNFVGVGSTTEKKHANDKNGCAGGDSAFVLMAFKVLIVAVLALSTKKKLTIGITLSALALLLTELVAARVLTRFKLCKKGKPVASIHDKNAISCEKIKTFDVSSDEIRIPKSHTNSVSCLEETETIAVTEKSKLETSTIRDLLLKDVKSTSKSSSLKSKIVKKLRSYRKKKKTVVVKEETLIEVSSLVPENKSESERDEEKLNPPLIESKGANMNGTVLIVIVLIGLLSGKILAIVLTLSCLFLRLGAAKKSGLCI